MSTTTTENQQRPRFKNTIHLWEFLLELLNNERYASIISWTRKEYGEFKLKKQEEVARQWGLLKQRKGMNYDKLSRSLRYYYDKRIIKKVSGQRLVYRFIEIPFEYLPLRNMDEKTRRKQLQSSSVIIPTTNTSPSLPPTPPLRNPYVETERSPRRDVQHRSVIRHANTKHVQSIETRDIVPHGMAPRVKTSHVQSIGTRHMVPHCSAARVATNQVQVIETRDVVPHCSTPQVETDYVQSINTRHMVPHARDPRVKSNHVQVIESRDIVPHGSTPRVVSKSQIIFPPCGCIMMGSNVVVHW